MLEHIKSLKLKNFLCLLQSEEITLDEAYAFILSEHQIMVERSKTIIYPKKPKTHLIRVAHLYTKIYVFMNHCLDICGMHSLTVSLTLLFSGHYGSHDTVSNIQN